MPLSQNLKKSDKCDKIKKIFYGVCPERQDKMSKLEDYIDTIKAEAPAKFEEIKDNIKLRNFLKKKEAEEIIEEAEEERKIKVWVIILAVIGVIAIGCLIGYIIYRKKKKPDYLDDFDSDFADDDEFFEDEE